MYEDSYQNISLGPLYGMKSRERAHSQTSAVAPLKFGMGK